MVNPEKQALLKDEDASMYISMRAGYVNQTAAANGENRQGSAAAAVAPTSAGASVPSTSTQNPKADDELTQASVPSIGPGELPPPYQQCNSGGVPMVTCRVCQQMIDITSKRDQHVVKCPQCNEATPIRNAPPGKKYVRCPCNCLLICKTISQRIACPRTNCKRIINLAPSPVTPPVPTMPGMCRVTCGHCSDTFLFNRMNKSFARCPHCRKVSSVGRRFALVHGCSVGVVSLIIFITGIGVTVGTLDYAATHGGMYVAYIALFLLAACLLARSLYYFCLKISHCDSPM